jgi:hypothetical protein
MTRRPLRGLATACAIGLLAVVAGSTATAVAGDESRTQHVLLLSVDGLHQTDLAWYVSHNPYSAIAALTLGGVEFTGAQTPVPSDSFPGMVAQVTGGNPRSTGIYYDDSFNHAMFPAGTTNCSGTAPGAEVTYFEAAARNPHALDSGQGLPGLPGSILQLTANPQTLIDPAQLPVDPKSCKPVYPHSYLQVNTIFEVARAAGLRTAWSDKHAAYDVLNGPSGGIQDLFTPEINSDAPTLGSSIDWTKDNTLTQQYDSYKVQAVINEINGFDHSGTAQVGTPAIFGMNFQTVSTAEKLPKSGGQPGGYLADGVTPGPVLSGALDYINGKVGAIGAALKNRHLDRSTVIILSAKHGQSPDTPSLLTRIPDVPIVGGLNAAWKAAHPSSSADLVAVSVNDDGVIMWLSDRSEEATEFAKSYLLNHSGIGNDSNGNPKPYAHSGLTKVYAGEAAAEYFGAKPGDPRVPDIFGIAQVGTVFTGGRGKIAEHGGANPQDRDVPLVVSGPSLDHHGVNNHPVETTQIAPTILRLLGLNPSSLKAVRIEGTKVLPLGDVRQDGGGLNS